VSQIQDVESKDKQITVELWANNIDFAGFDLRLGYDSTKVALSDLSTNDYITQSDHDTNNFVQAFWAEAEFGTDIDTWIVDYQDNYLQYVFSLNIPPISGSEHIASYMVDEEGEPEARYKITTGADERVLLGRFSFRLFSGKVEEDTFYLASGATTPTTGIKVAIDGINSYQDPSVFRIITQEPAGTIIGSIETMNWEEIYIANVKVYRTNVVDWENLYGHEELDEIETVKTVTTNEDGTYEIGLPLGKYDVLIDKPGHLDYVIEDVIIENEKVEDLGHTALIAGDYNKDGMVDGEDTTILYRHYGEQEELSSEYKIDYDPTENGMVDGEDTTLVYRYYGTMRDIITWGGI
jgi:hypothetical protein